jgi:hypothetical protein
VNFLVECCELVTDNAKTKRIILIQTLPGWRGHQGLLLICFISQVSYSRNREDVQRTNNVEKLPKYAETNKRL